ncbi:MULTISPECIES: GNAT family N-acetyltransferase [unclassified Legionella]|uniref:GNAT family N-acetyltransferase n=1 Tax=unclassified Legionella TaxID=2622702 RepID=UPI001E4A4F2B|nr:GNAT family N-acetyltransferase [Legionella sp. 31fI33]MCC5015717.1 GNAT family N-acetyltransferase [Legionella sp. 31fI33]
MNNELIDFFKNAEDYFFRAISKKCIEFPNQAVIYLTGVEAESLNLLICKENISDSKTIFTKSAQIFLSQALPWTIAVCEQSFNERLQNSLETIGFGYREKGVAMFAELQQSLKLPPAPDLLIKETDKNLTDWMLPLVEAFESAYDICTQYKEAHKNALLNGAKLAHFCLYENDKPVSALTLSKNKNLIRIDDVGTLPAHQRKGYASYLISYVLEQARLSGAKFCFLEASEAGLSVYEKLGFQPLFKRQYMGETGSKILS